MLCELFLCLKRITAPAKYKIINAKDVPIVTSLRVSFCNDKGEKDYGKDYQDRQLKRTGICSRNE